MFSDCLLNIGVLIWLFSEYLLVIGVCIIYSVVCLFLEYLFDDGIFIIYSIVWVLVFVVFMFIVLLALLLSEYSMNFGVGLFIMFVILFDLNVFRVIIELWRVYDAYTIIRLFSENLFNFTIFIIL